MWTMSELLPSTVSLDVRESVAWRWEGARLEPVRDLLCQLLDESDVLLLVDGDWQTLLRSR